MREIEDRYKAYRDLKNSLDTATRDGFKQGMAEGMEKGMAEGMEKGMEKGREEGRTSALLSIAQEMKKANLSVEHIQKFTGLTEEEIKRL